MAKRQGPEPKIQRGISMQRELYNAIRADADRLGMTFNEVAEAALKRSFLVARDVQNSPEIRRIRHAELVELPK